MLIAKVFLMSSVKWITNGVFIMAFTRRKAPDVPSHSGTSMLLPPAHLRTAVVALEQQHAQCDRLLVSLPPQDLNDLGHLLGPCLSAPFNTFCPTFTVVWYHLEKSFWSRRDKRISLRDGPLLCVDGLFCLGLTGLQGMRKLNVCRCSCKAPRGWHYIWRCRTG